MPAIANNVLYQKLLSSLPEGAQILTAQDEVRPLIANFSDPQGPVRIYLWTITEDFSCGSRPIGEHRMQLILPNQPRGTRGQLELDSRTTTLLLGFSPILGVFSAWQAEMHSDFGYSTSVQVSEQLLEKASETGWAVDSPRVLRGGNEEVGIAFSGANLAHIIQTTKQAAMRGLRGVAREAYFLSKTPNEESEQPGVDLEKFITLERHRLQTSRLVRNSNFEKLYYPNSTLHAPFAEFNLT